MQIEREKKHLGEPLEFAVFVKYGIFNAKLM